MSTNAVLAACGLLGLDGLRRYLSYSSEPAPLTEYVVGPASDYPLGSRTVLTRIPALLIHDQEGYSALSLVCPHLGCTVNDTDEGLVCPCHGSRFDAQGAVLRAPAREPLRVLRVEVTADDELRLILN
ncbi:MAG: Rieske (2Fe-2S) protein [Anaerolineae bacterium]|nr:Rieske (2Fe-2S) protein [Chloroflexota bacterium]MBP6297899.1 Rieske (2Fe-2S) protein [Anaerolineae bacterium]